MSSSARGRDPQALVEKIVRDRIYASRFYREHCFALSAEGLAAKATQLVAIGGIFSERGTPAPFLCLILKMLQMAPSLDIVHTLLRNEDFKYVRALGAFYCRLTMGDARVLYGVLDPLMSDYRTLRVQTRTGWTTTTMDAFVDELLVGQWACDVALPPLTKRDALERSGVLGVRESLLSTEFAQILEALK